MAESIVVHLSRTKLPLVDDIVEALQAKGFPLAKISSWDWSSHVGWLPMSWADEGTGFELEVLQPAERGTNAPLETSMKTDCEVLVETRGYRSLQCGAAFAAVVADLADGVVSDGTQEFSSPSELYSWANGVISASEEGISSENRRLELAATLDSPSRISEGFNSLLAAMIGRIASFPTVDSSIKLEHYSLHLRTDSMIQCQGLSWRLIIDGEVFDKTKRPAAQDRLERALRRWYEEDGYIVGESIPEKYRLEYQTLYEEIESSEEADDSVALEALQIVASWSEGLIIESVRWLPPHTMEIELSGATERRIQYVAGGQMSEFDVSSSELRFQVGREIRLL